MATMTKKHARAILAGSAAILKACERIERSIADWPERDNAQAYWLGHLRNIASGSGYGSMPVNRARETLGE